MNDKPDASSPKASENDGLPSELVENSADSVAITRQTNMAFLLKDFEKTFDVYIYAHSERSEATKMFVMLCTAPFIIISLFGITSNIDIAHKTLIEVVGQFPNFMFLIFTIFGVVGVVPFHRFVAAHANTYKMIRYMNNYRLFFYQLFHEELRDLQWASAIEKDPRHPIPRISFHWTSGFALAMFLVNTAYVCVGLYLYDDSKSGLVLWLALLISIIVHSLLAASELKTRDIDRLGKNHVPIDDLLKNIDRTV